MLTKVTRKNQFDDSNAQAKNETLRHSGNMSDKAVITLTSAINMRENARNAKYGSENHTPASFDEVAMRTNANKVSSVLQESYHFKDLVASTATVAAAAAGGAAGAIYPSRIADQATIKAFRAHTAAMMDKINARELHEQIMTPLNDQAKRLPTQKAVHINNTRSTIAIRSDSVECATKTSAQYLKNAEQACVKTLQNADKARLVENATKSIVGRTTTAAIGGGLAAGAAVVAGKIISKTIGPAGELFNIKELGVNPIEAREHQMVNYGY